MDLVDICTLESVAEWFSPLAVCTREPWKPAGPIERASVMGWSMLYHLAVGNRHTVGGELSHLRNHAVVCTRRVSSESEVVWEVAVFRRKQANGAVRQYHIIHPATRRLRL